MFGWLIGIEPKNISDCMYFKYDFGYVHRKVHAQRAEQKNKFKA